MWPFKPIKPVKEGTTCMPISVNTPKIGTIYRLGSNDPFNPVRAKIIDIKTNDEGVPWVQYKYLGVYGLSGNPISLEAERFLNIYKEE